MRAYVIKGLYSDIKAITELLRKRIGESKLVGARAGFLYYPYWLINFEVKALMALGISRVYREVYLMVDGITGFVGYSVKPDLDTEELDEGRVLTLKIAEDVALSIAKEYVKRTFQILKRLTMLKDMEINAIERLVIYKRFWLIQLSEEKKVWLLFDSVSGSSQFVVPRDIGIEANSAR